MIYKDPIGDKIDDREEIDSSKRRSGLPSTSKTKRLTVSSQSRRIILSLMACAYFMTLHQSRLSFVLWTTAITKDIDGNSRRFLDTPTQTSMIRKTKSTTPTTEMVITQQPQFQSEPDYKHLMPASPSEQTSQNSSQTSVSTFYDDNSHVSKVWKQHQPSSTNYANGTWWTDSRIVLPQNDNTVIALISFAGTRTTLIVERCIRSIRTSGAFTGYVMVVTDTLGYQNYNQTLVWDPKVVVVPALTEDMIPRDVKNGQIIVYHKKSTMPYKRFKTLLMEYVDRHPRLTLKTRYVLYLDVDNVVTAPLTRFFHDYHQKISSDFEKTKAKLSNVTNSNKADANNSDSIDPGFSFFSFWRDGKNGKSTDYWQGGQTMYDRIYSRGCAAAWQHQMDTVYSFLDQPLLYAVYENFTYYKCKIFDMGKRSKHFSLMTPKILGMMAAPSPTSSEKDQKQQTSKKKIKRRRRRQRLPTFVHITSVRAKKYPESLQIQLIRKAMQLPPLVDANQNSNNKNFSVTTPTSMTTQPRMMMVDGISWDDVARPIGSRGQNLKKKNRKRNRKNDNNNTGGEEVG